MPDTIHELVRRQKDFFKTGATRDIDFRIGKLRRFRSMIEENEAEILDALGRDMGKPPVEAYTSEIGMLLAEIRFAQKHLKRWAKPQSAGTMLFHMPARSRIVHEPYGVACIIGPWNYPFQLVLSPLMGAIAAGNCAVIKPSEMSVHSETLLSEMIREYFDPQYIAAVTGDAACAAELIRQPLDYIFFTGSSETGKKILEGAAEHLTPCTLELGGKNPCIVDSDTDISKTARRIVWGKFFNAGQTCVAPDYVLVNRKIEDRFKHELITVLGSFYGDSTEDYARIVNTRHFDRLMSLMDGCNIIYGGNSDRDNLRIEPTLVDNVSFSDPIMSEEIFGPVLPILGYDDIGELLSIVEEKPKPLAVYLFSRDKGMIRKVTDRISAGSMCINGTLSQMISFTLPFGGVGKSGMGRYHGRYSYQTFSHEKAVMHKSFLFDPDTAYPPYNVSVSFIKRAIRVLFRHI